MYFLDEEAVVKVDALEEGTIKTDLEARISSLKSYYASLTSLDMSNKNTSQYDISTGALVNFTGLTELNLSNTGLTDIGGLVGLTSMEILDVSDNAITDLYALVDMTNLTELNISSTEITDLNVLVVDGTTDTRFASLTVLQATDISTLTSIAGLVHVAANDTQSSDVVWNFDGSTLASDPDNHIGQIETNRDEATFTPPNVPTT